jgi:hypothetical protein
MDEYRSSRAFLDWAFAMMDLEEARISLGSYADQLDLGCGLHKLAVDLAAKEKTAGLIEQRATGVVDKSIGELRRLQKEAVILCILVDEGITREAGRFVRLPLEYAKLWQAKNRVTSVLDQAGAILQEHDRREAVKNEPPMENAIVAAIRKFTEKRELELEAERIESISNRRLDDF